MIITSSYDAEASFSTSIDPKITSNTAVSTSDDHHPPGLYPIIKGGPSCFFCPPGLDNGGLVLWGMKAPGIYPPPMPPPFPKFPTMTIGNNVEPTPEPEDDDDDNQSTASHDDQSTKSDDATSATTAAPSTTSSIATTSSATSSRSFEPCAITCSACADGGGSSPPSTAPKHKRVSAEFWQLFELVLSGNLTHLVIRILWLFMKQSSKRCADIVWLADSTSAPKWRCKGLRPQSHARKRTTTSTSTSGSYRWPIVSFGSAARRSSFRFVCKRFVRLHFCCRHIEPGSLHVTPLGNTWFPCEWTFDEG